MQLSGNTLHHIPIARIIIFFQIVSRILFKNMISDSLCQSVYIIKFSSSKISPKHNKFMPQMSKDVFWIVSFSNSGLCGFYFHWLRIQQKTCLRSETIKVFIRSVCNINNINPLTHVRACSSRAQVLALCTLKGLQL